jgi:hypothetical protein
MQCDHEAMMGGDPPAEHLDELRPGRFEPPGDPEQAIDRTEARSSRGGPLQHRELMPERENFRRELEPRTDRGSEASRATNSAVILPEDGISLCPQPQRPQHVRNIQ